MIHRILAFNWAVSFASALIRLSFLPAKRSSFTSAGDRGLEGHKPHLRRLAGVPQERPRQPRWRGVDRRQRASERSASQRARPQIVLYTGAVVRLLEPPDSLPSLAPAPFQFTTHDFADPPKWDVVRGPGSRPVTMGKAQLEQR